MVGGVGMSLSDNIPWQLINPPSSSRPPSLTLPLPALPPALSPLPCSCSCRSHDAGVDACPRHPPPGQHLPHRLPRGPRPAGAPAALQPRPPHLTGGGAAPPLLRAVPQPPRRAHRPRHHHNPHRRQHKGGRLVAVAVAVVVACTVCMLGGSPRLAPPSQCVPASLPPPLTTSPARPHLPVCLPACLPACSTRSASTGTGCTWKL